MTTRDTRATGGGKLRPGSEMPVVVLLPYGHLVEDYLEAGKKRPAGDKAWAATSDAVHAPAMNLGVKW